MDSMAETDSDVGAIVRKARLGKGLSQPELAQRVGTKQQTIQKIEGGIIKHSSFLPAIANELGIAQDKVVRNAKGLSAPLETVPASRLIGENRDLKVYGVVQGGSGALILSNDPVEYVARPEPLARVTNGYGVIVVEDSMAPEFRSGDIALVNPNIPPRSGDTCIFRHVEPDGSETACIKYLRRQTESAWQVSEWQAADGSGTRDFSLKKAEWQTCHVTVGNYKRR
jgi:phage repressor protein C with HTH and peptisase S24 domain